MIWRKFYHNYGNLLSSFLGKNFVKVVKVTFLLKKLLNIYLIWRNFFSVTVNFCNFHSVILREFFVFPVYCVSHSFYKKFVKAICNKRIGYTNFFFFARWISRFEQKIHFINFFNNYSVHEKFSTALCDYFSITRVKKK